jgi:16S rRNA pseudouridine516 synthase
MLAAAGNHCAALTRSAIGGLQLDALELGPGEWKYLEAEQLALLSLEQAL